MAGKIKRLDALYYFRNVGVLSNPRSVEGWNQWFLKDFDEFFNCYKEYRAKIVDFGVKQSSQKLDPDRLRRTIELAFMFYIGREFHILYWIPEYLSAAIVDQNERDRLERFLRQRLVDQSQTASSVVTPVYEPTPTAPLRRFSGLNIPRSIQARFSDEKWELLYKRLGSMSQAWS